MKNFLRVLSMLAGIASFYAVYSAFKDVEKALLISMGIAFAIFSSRVWPDA